MKIEAGQVAVVTGGTGGIDPERRDALAGRSGRKIRGS
jgi:hypothetical protein